MRLSYKRDKQHNYLPMYLAWHYCDSYTGLMATLLLRHNSPIKQQDGDIYQLYRRNISLPDAQCSETDFGRAVR